MESQTHVDVVRGGVHVLNYDSELGRILSICTWQSLFNLKKVHLLVGTDGNGGVLHTPIESRGIQSPPPPGTNEINSSLNVF